MSSRAWQMVAAGVSIALMIVVILQYGTCEAPPSKSSEPHAGGKHHTAEKHEGHKPWPLPAFVDVKVGDWIAFETSQQIANGQPKVTRTLVKVEAIDDRQLTLSQSERENRLDPPAIRRDELPRQGLTIDRVLGNDEQEWTLYNLSTREETREVSGRTFASTRLSFSLISPLESSKRARVEVWTSTSVPLDGVIELRQVFEDVSLQVTRKLIGFGTADAITWGTKPDGL